MSMEEAKRRIALVKESGGTELDLTNLGLTELPLAEVLELSGTLIKLNISSNRIGYEGAKSIAENLKNLSSLNISYNLIGYEGAKSIAENLKNLSSLAISDNYIRYEGAKSIAENLKNLSSLYISSNSIGDEGIRVIYNAYKNLPAIKISLWGNSTDSIPPSATASWAGLKEYFASIAGKQTVELGALNILLLGNTMAGKSSLLDFYLTGKFKPRSKTKRTWGIEHRTEDDFLDQKNLRVSFWDFGGQEYFHGTHRMFIGGRNALYLVLWQPEFEQEETRAVYKILHKETDEVCYPAAYWLGTIQHFEHGEEVAPRTLLIRAKLDEQTTLSIQEPVIPLPISPENIFNLSAKEASGKAITDDRDYYKALWTIFANRFKKLILKQQGRYKFNAEMLKILGDEGLVKWRTEKGLVINREAFLNLCSSFYKNADNFILAYLQDCGEILLFEQNERLKNKVFIDPKGLLNSIYDILNKQVRKKGGLFTEANIRVKDKAALLEVMLEMDLAFEDPRDPGNYIAPQFMNDNLEVSRLLEHLHHLLKVAFVLRFPHFMPRGRITQFISQKGKDAEDGVFWKFGVLYNFTPEKGEPIKVLVEADEGNRFIKVYADDKPGKYEALKEVFNWFAYYGPNLLNQTEEKAVWNIEKGMTHKKTLVTGIKKGPFRFHEIITPLELSANGNTYAAIDEIEKAINERANMVKSSVGGYLPISSIFHVLLNKTDIMPKKIFFSYSRYDRLYRDEFEVHFAPLKRQGLIETWYDGEILSGEDANAKIMSKLVDADIIFCLLSPQFMANDYIWNIEMQKAKDMGKIIVPISIKACDYKKYFAEFFEEDKQGYLTQKQFDVDQTGKTLKRDIIWIASEQNEAKRDEYYNFIVDKVKSLF